MNYLEIKRAVLELINQYSIAGENIADDYNNQSDYVNKIPNLINQAVTDIRTAIRPKRGVFDAETEEYELVRLPDNCRRIISGGVNRVTDRGVLSCNDYKLLGDKQIYLPPGKWLIEYDQFPDQLPINPADTFDFREEPDVTQAAIYAAAAHLIRDDSEFDYTALKNEYEDRKSRLFPPIMAEYRPIEDVY